MDEQDAGSRSDNRPSEHIVEQCVRNRVIEYLDLAASYEAQQRYERDAPIAYIPSEVIEQWADNFPRTPQPDADLHDMYSADEVEAVRRFHAVWDAAADAIRGGHPSLSEVQATREWQQLRLAAASARDIYARRGPMPEDQEVP